MSATTGGTLRVVVADDHPLMRDGLCRSLEAFDVEVVGGVGDGRAAVAAVERSHPDLVLMDVSMPSMDGIQATEIIRSRHPEVTVIVLTFDGDDELRDRAMAAGAAAVLTKDTPADEVVAAIRVATGGEQPEQPPAPMLERGGELTLTARELEILGLITRGASTTRIGTDLYISVKTVKNHLASIYSKLDVTDRTQAVLRALRLGLVSLDS